MIHDRHTTTELVRLLHVVRRQHDRLPVAVQLAEDLPQREPALGVKTGRRLVQEQHGRPMEDRSRDHQPLRHAARERIHRRVGPARELELLEQPLGDLA